MNIFLRISAIIGFILFPVARFVGVNGCGPALALKNAGFAGLTLKIGCVVEALVIISVVIIGIVALFLVELQVRSKDIVYRQKFKI